MGDWAPGVAYKKADFVRGPGGLMIVGVNHLSCADLEDDIADSKIAVYGANGVDGSDAVAIDHQRFTALGTVTSGSRTLGFHVMTEACELQAAHPVADAIASPITGGGSSFTVQLKKVTPLGAMTTIGTLTFADGVPADIEAINASFAQYDALLVVQIGGGSRTGGGDLSITVPLIPA